jgi:hypothetical protein
MRSSQRFIKVDLSEEEEISQVTSNATGPEFDRLKTIKEIFLNVKLVAFVEKLIHRILYQGNRA